jgi:hypothetical protein
MILEVQKIDNQYVIKNPPKNVDEHFFLNVEAKDIVKLKPNKKRIQQKDESFAQLQIMANAHPKDELLQMMVKYYKPHSTVKQLSDKEVLQKHLMEKYGK